MNRPTTQGKETLASWQLNPWHQKRCKFADTTALVKQDKGKRGIAGKSPTTTLLKLELAIETKIRKNQFSTFMDNFIFNKYKSELRNKTEREELCVQSLGLPLMCQEIQASSDKQRHCSGWDRTPLDLESTDPELGGHAQVGNCGQTLEWRRHRNPACTHDAAAHTFPNAGIWRAGASD